MTRPRPHLRAVSGADDPDPPVSDADLLRSIALGGEMGLRELWDRYGRAVLGVCRAELRDPTAAEDATQEAFTRIWRSAGSFDPARGAASSWILTVARNAARNVARSRKPTEPLGEHHAVGDEHESRVADRFWVEGALAQLSPLEARYVRMSFFDGLTHSQIAASTGTPIGTVKTRIRRALGRLADLEERR